MKLISLNIEGSNHLDRIFPFIQRENPDILCLQETNEPILSDLKKLGYKTTFAPLFIRTIKGKGLEMGVIIASKHPFTSETFYYYRPSAIILQFNADNKRGSIAQPLVFASITVESEKFNVATTHFTWAPDGDVASDEQIKDMRVLRAKLASYPTHILCGDFNIPRRYNKLYSKLREGYIDEIPAKYKSSLDKELHILNKAPEKAHLLEKYMVDYIFTQSPYHAKNVRLEFGLSDHAAVIANINIIQ